MAQKKSPPIASAKGAIAPILPRKEPVQERSRVRFDRILSEANELIINSGVDAVAMSEIAQKAEISVASLYQYFSDKAAIIASLADRYNQSGQECVQGRFAEVQSADDLKPALADVLDEYFAFFRDVPGSYAVWQATQSDARLHQIDEEDCSLHAQTICAGICRTLPKLSEDEAFHYGRLFTLMIGSVIRNAIGLEASEATAIIQLCKEGFLFPAVDKLIAEVGG